MLTALWIMGLTIFIFVVALGVGAAVDIPGWSPALAWRSFGSMMLIAFLTVMLMPAVALIASSGRGYLPPLGWAFLTMAFAQIAAVMGWGEWFPWAVPSLLSEFSGPQSGPLGIHSYLMVVLVFIFGIAGTFVWWRSADQTQ
jgi:ABC-2 type transport system permease protein